LNITHTNESLELQGVIESYLKDVKHNTKVQSGNIGMTFNNIFWGSWDVY